MTQQPNPYAVSNSQGDRQETGRRNPLVGCALWFGTVLLGGVIGGLIGLVSGAMYGESVADSYVRGFNQADDAVTQFATVGLVQGGFYGALTFCGLFMVWRLWPFTRKRER